MIPLELRHPLIKVLERLISIRVLPTFLGFSIRLETIA